MAVHPPFRAAHGGPERLFGKLLAGTDAGWQQPRYTLRCTVIRHKQDVVFVDDEQALMAAARRRDPDALATIHDTYYDALYGYIAYRVSDPLAAEDLTSEVFTRLLAALHEGRPPRTTLRGWLFGVASRVVADHHRSQYRAQHVALDESLIETGSGLFDRLQDKLNHEALARALEDLTGEQQAVISLRFGAGLSIREVAGMVGRSEAAVKMLQARAIAALARKLAA